MLYFLLVAVTAVVAGALADQDRLSRISVDPSTGHFVDELGRVRFFRGINSVLKKAPWYEEVMLDSSRHAQLADLGFNVVRLGAMWTGIEPTKEDVVNNSYVEVLERIVDSLSSQGVYTLLDMHQDVLWQPGPEDSTFGWMYWGVPPWLKHKLPSPQHLYPWPLASVHPSMWICGYFSQEISKGFQDIYNDEMGASQSFAAVWKFLAGTFAGRTGVLGYELLNEPWAGDIFADASLLLPGVAGRRNLEPLYRLANQAIRQADNEAIVFWEPVTWGYALPIKANAVMDRLIEGIMSRHTMKDFLAILKPICGTIQDSVNVTGDASLKAFKNVVSEISAVFQGKHNDDPSTLSQQRTVPSVWGPGLSEVPGGSNYLNRTAMSWHYYCWILFPSDAPYDPAKKFFCDSVHAPRTFSTVQQRVAELGNRGRMLTEFGLCYPNISNPNTQNTEECVHVMEMADKNFESWIYWDTASGGNILWDKQGRLLPEVAAVFSRPYPMAVAGTPITIKFDMKSKQFRFEFEADPRMSNLATEIFVPELHYPDGAFVVSVSTNLRWEKAASRKNVILVFLQDSSQSTNAQSTFVQLSPKREERSWFFTFLNSISVTA